MAYIFGGNTGITPQELKQRRAYANAMRSRMVSPATLEGGIQNFASGILGRLAAKNADETEAAMRGAANNAWGEWAGGGYSGEAPTEHFDWMNKAQQAMVMQMMQRGLPLTEAQQLANQVAQLQIDQTEQNMAWHDKERGWKEEDRRIAMEQLEKENQLWGVIENSLRGNAELPEEMASSPVGQVVMDAMNNPARARELLKASADHRGKGIRSIMGGYYGNLGDLRDKTMTQINNFKNRDTYKNYENALDRMSAVVAFAKNDDAPSNVGAITNFVRAIDNSQVTGEEAKRYGQQSAFEEVMGIFKAAEGKGSLGTDARQRLINAANTYLSATSARYKPRVEKFRKSLSDSGLDMALATDNQFEATFNINDPDWQRISYIDEKDNTVGVPGYDPDGASPETPSIVDAPDFGAAYEDNIEGMEGNDDLGTNPYMPDQSRFGGEMQNMDPSLTPQAIQQSAPAVGEWQADDLHTAPAWGGEPKDVADPMMHNMMMEREERHSGEMWPEGGPQLPPIDGDYM